MEAFKCINHSDKQTCNVICHLLNREIGKNPSSGQYFCLFQEAANCWKTSGCSTSEVTHCFQALPQQCCCSGDEADDSNPPYNQVIGLSPKNVLYGQYEVTSLSLQQKSLYTKMKNCPVQPRICLYGLGMTWPLVEAGLLFEHFFPACTKRLIFRCNTTASLSYFTSVRWGGRTIPGRQGQDRGISCFGHLLENHYKTQQDPVAPCSQKW